MISIYIIHKRHRKDVDPYAYNDESVTILTNDRDRVRQSPQVYLPNIEKEGALHLFEEILSNAIDEVASPNTISNDVYITFDEDTKIVSIQDFGRGFPLGKVKAMCEVLSSSAKMGENNRAYSTSGGVHGMGLKLVNYLSKYMIIRTERDGKYIKIHYEDGLQKELVTGKSKEHGTYLEWKYSKRFFKNIDITCEELIEIIKLKSYVTKNVMILFNGKDKKGKSITKEFKKTGFKDFMKRFNIISPVIEGNSLFGDNNVEFIFGYDTEIIDSYNILAYTNNIYNKLGGSHVDGLLEAITYFMRKYMYETYLNEKDKKTLKIKAEDCRTGIVGIISLYTLNPKFKSQFKEALDDNDLKNFVFRSVRYALNKLDTIKLNKVCAIIKSNCKARMASETTKKKVRREDITNIFSDDRIDAYIPISKHSTSDFRELFIVEGLSARGGMKSVVDRNSQAILAVRGKIENVFDLDQEEAVKQSKFLSNLTNIFNCGIGKNFDINRFPFDRINLATDADTDGNEIACQEAMMFVKFFPQIVQDGRLYKVVPPLYEVKNKGKTIFVPTIREFMNLTQKNFAKDHKIYINNKVVSEDDIIKFLIRNERYVENLERISNQYAISSTFCEFIIANRHIGFDNDKISEWNRILPSLFRFIKAEKGHKYLILSGMVKSEYNLFEYTIEFNEDIKPAEVIDSYYGYNLDNTANMSLYEILRLFNNYKPKIITRFKGLGEMNSEDMERTMMKRDVRNSIRLTMDDIEESFYKISVMHSKKKEFSDKRKEFMKHFKFDLLEIDT